jgi:integrase
VAALRAHHDRQGFERSALNEAYADHALVFASAVGTPLDASNVVHHFKAALRRAGLPDRYRPHDLRHAAATLMLRAGVHPKVASERLGHANTQITLDLYTHAVPGLEAEAASRIHGALSEARKKLNAAAPGNAEQADEAV